ncbi:MAG: HAMP domain-containing sensor histidine kinase [Pseudomonadota bacterium]
MAEINALTQRGIWSRLGFSAFVAAIACTVVPWHLVTAWLGVVLLWEFVVRRAIERWTKPASADDRSEHSLRKVAAVHALGAAIYATLGALGFLSHTMLGAQIAMGWITGAAIHAFVYFSNRRTLLLADLSGPIFVALALPTIAAGGFAWSAVLSTVVTLALLASAAVFATDRNALLAHLSTQIAARRAAEEANAAKTQFLNTISHELRTPLNAVIGYSEMLEEDLAEMGAEQQRADATHIRIAGRHLLTLINDILQLSRQEANAPLVKHVETDLPALVAEIETMARALAAERGNRFTLEAALPPAAILDRIKLTDCLFKLISNAAKFTQDGLITLRVWTETGRIIFELTDTGVGMAPATRANVFEPFFQSDGSMTRRHEGAGLGLAVARKNARLMGGDISVESELGRGSTFTLWLPLSVLESEVIPPPLSYATA